MIWTRNAGKDVGYLRHFFPQDATGSKETRRYRREWFRGGIKLRGRPAHVLRIQRYGDAKSLLESIARSSVTSMAVRKAYV